MQTRTSRLRANNAIQSKLQPPSSAQQSQQQTPSQTNQVLGKKNSLEQNIVSQNHFQNLDIANIEEDNGLDLSLQICATEPNDFVNNNDKDNLQVGDDLLNLSDQGNSKAVTPKRHERASFHQRQKAQQFNNRNEEDKKPQSTKDHQPVSSFQSAQVKSKIQTNFHNRRQTTHIASKIDSNLKPNLPSTMSKNTSVRSSQVASRTKNLPGKDGADEKKGRKALLKMQKSRECVGGLRRFGFDLCEP